MIPEVVKVIVLAHRWEVPQWLIKNMFQDEINLVLQTSKVFEGEQCV